MITKYAVVCGDLSSKNPALKYPTYYVTGESSPFEGEWHPKLAILACRKVDFRQAKLYDKKDAERIIQLILNTKSMSALDKLNPKLVPFEFNV